MKSCVVAFTNSTVTIEFDPALVGIRGLVDIIEVINACHLLILGFQGIGFSAKLVKREDPLKNIDYSNDESKWRKSLLISLIFGIPTLAVMAYFHWIVNAPMNPERQIPILSPALSLDNLLLFLLCTPVQVCLSRSLVLDAFYRSMEANTSIFKPGRQFDMARPTWTY